MKNRKLSKSFSHAFTGIREAVASERNMRSHLASVGLVVCAGLVLRVDAVRWAVLAGLCALVIGAELLNTAFEYLVDMVTTEVREEARRVKDMAAGAVLAVSVFALAGGIAVFWSPGLAFLGSVAGMIARK